MEWFGPSAADSPGESWTRRRLLVGAAQGVAGLLVFARSPRAESSPAASLPKAAQEALRASPLVYISPLLADGGESRCHGEVWYFVDAGSVVIITAADGWKARAVRRGRGQARLWVGDFGPVGAAGDRFRAAPSFEARAEIVSDPAVFGRLMAAFGKRYPESWGKWKPRFEKGFAGGSRVMVRYSPVAGERVIDAG